MNIQVITDSTSDISPELASKYGIRIVPIYIRFGDKVFSDGADMDTDTFYKTLVVSPAHPATSQPTPEDFENVYREYCDKADGIISIHISSKISGTYNSAMLAKKNLGSRCPIEVIDSRFNSAGLALATLFAARLSRVRDNLEVLAEEVRNALHKIDMFGYFDTMKYLAWSGRVNKAIVSAANILKVKPLLTFHDGDIVRAGLVRSLARGMDRLEAFVRQKHNIAELVIVHSQIPEQAEKLKARLADIFPPEKTLILKMGAGLGVHGGPGVLLTGIRTE